MHDEKWIKQLYAWSFKQSACVEICFETHTHTDPDTEFKMFRGWTIKILDNEIEKSEVMFMNIVTGNADQSALKSVVYNINWLITSHKPGHPCIGQCIVCSGSSTVITKY